MLVLKETREPQGEGRVATGVGVAKPKSTPLYALPGPYQVAAVDRRPAMQIQTIKKMWYKSSCVVFERATDLTFWGIASGLMEDL